MSRSHELESAQLKMEEANDQKIVDALRSLEQAAGPALRLPTVEDVRALAGVSRNTVRSRPWALDRLKAIKRAYKSARTSTGSPIGEAAVSGPPSLAEAFQSLQDCYKAALRQNALLYEEVLHMKDALRRKDIELENVGRSAARGSAVLSLK